MISGFTLSSPYSTVADTFYITEDLTYSINFTASDEGDGGAALYTVNHKPTWLTTLGTVNGTFSGKPDNRHVGLDYLDVTFSDGNGGSDNERVYLRVQNVISSFIDPPDSVVATEDSEFSLDLNSTDEGYGTITYSVTSGDPGWFNLNAATGVITSKTGRPNNNDVTDGKDVTIQVDDGNGGIATKTFVFIVRNVNDAPTWTSVPSGIITIWEDAAYSVTVTASDVDVSDVLTYSLVSPPTGMTINSSSGLITWTPTNSQVGSHTITVKVTDTGSASITSSWTLQVKNLNDSPTWVSVPSGTIATYEDALYTVTIGATDIDLGDYLSYALTVKPAAMTINASTGVIEWTPTNDDVGLHNITATATDDSSAVISASWQLDVENVNDAPVLAAIPADTTAEDAPYSITVSASDVDAGDVITYILFQKPAGMTINPSSGLVNWTPDNSQVGDYRIWVLAKDIWGDGDTQDWTVRVTNTASPISVPVAGDFSPSAAVTAVADTFYLKEDTTYSLNLSSPDEGVGVESIYSFDDFANPDWITLSNATTGTIGLTPTNGDVGLDSFQVYFKAVSYTHLTLPTILRV